MEDWRHGGFGLYLHWPFCASKCPYCDFNSHVAETIDQDDWAAAYEAEIARAASQLPDRVLNSIYFGGGTPSLMEPRVVERALEAARAWTWANDIEITLEANPTSVEVAKFQDYRSAGVNRVSLGVQALNDPDLRRLGRAHDAAQARRALSVARDRFDRVSFDLIYARQDQTREAWHAELQEALSVGPDHLSLYQLTIEDGTVFGRRFAAGRLPGLPGEDLSVDMYDDTTRLCAAAGLNAYEVSNYARTGQESRHNLVYWRGGDYVGIGPGAHGRITLNDRRFATTCPLAPSAWLAKCRQTGSGEAERTELTPEERSEEFLLMGLRLSEGVDLTRFQALRGTAIDPKRLNHMIDLQMVRTEGTRLIATPQGRLVLNQVLAELIA